MRTHLSALLLASVLGACASAPQPQPEPAATPAAPTSTTSAPPAPSAPAAPPALEAPDVPSGATAARIVELARQATPLVDAFINSQALFTRDGKHLLFRSNRDGLPQIYIADASRPDAPARRLFSWSERVMLMGTTPDGKSMLFMSDKGADENWSIFKAGLDGSPPVELTPGEPLSRGQPFVPDLTPDTLYFSANRMSETATAVYAVPLAGGTARQVYRQDKPGSLVDVSRDGRHALFFHYPADEEYLLHLDLASGTTRLLYPQQGKISMSAARFSPDGKTVYLTTDGGGEQALLLALDAATGQEKARYVEQNPPTAELDGLAVAKTGDVLALSVNAGNRSEVRLLDARTLKPRAAVNLPLGQGYLEDFSEDGRRLIVSRSTPTTPMDPWGVDTQTGKVAPLRRESRPSLQAVPAMEVSMTSIRAHDGLELPLNVYLPKQRSGRLPVIVFYHGGPANSSRIKWNPMAAFFLSQGYAWVEPNVRGSRGFGRAFEKGDDGPRRPESFKDIEATGRWAASQPWADPSRVIVFGGSYGGYVVLVGLTRMPDLWRAGVDLFGVANMKTFMDTTSGSLREYFLVEFGDPDKDAAFLDSISPLRDAGRIVDPLFVYTGANDPRVPRGESDQIVRALRERKVPVEYMVADNEGHSLDRKENLVEFLARSALFLEQHAGPTQAPAAQ